MPPLERRMFPEFPDFLLDSVWFLNQKLVEV
jgi:hypothetical protein